MAKNKSQITEENVTEWLGSTGFIFPRTIAELSRFRKLYSEAHSKLTGSEIDPEVILGYKKRSVVASLNKNFQASSEAKLRMAARKGGNSLSKNIIDKIKKNQENRKQNDPGSSEEKPE